MLLYWGIFTLGFFAGSILAFITFAPRRPQDDPEYETEIQGESGILFPTQGLNQTHQQKISSAN